MNSNEIRSEIRRYAPDLSSMFELNPILLLFQLQEETTRLLLSLSRAQKQQQEYDQQLQEVRAALKRKSEDLEILKTKLSDEV